MNIRLIVRRVFPYLVIGIGGFALAYVVVFLFVLPVNVIHPKAPLPPDSTVGALTPIQPDTSTRDTPVGGTEPDTGIAVTPAPLPQTTHPQVPIQLPDLTGMSLSDARATLDGLQVNTVVEHDTSSFQPENTILRQTPKAGESVSAGNAVTLVVSRFPPAESSTASPHDSVSPDTSSHSRSTGNTTR